MPQSTAPGGVAPATANREMEPVTGAQPYISVNNIQKTYFPSPPWMKALVRTNIKEPVVAIENVSFEAGPGEIIAIVGPNGAGKTTTFRILVGLTTPTSGEARIMGLDSTLDSTRVRSTVGWMPGDDRSLLMRLSCKENLLFHGRMQGMDSKQMKQRVPEVLEQVGLGHAANKTIFALSAGMRARIQLARAIFHSPKVLILDEPTGAVDPVASHGLLNLIIDIVKENQLAALISSHRLEEIEALHSRVLLLDRGKVRYDGDLDSLREILDRPCIEFDFANPERALHARTLVETQFPKSTVSVVEETTVRCILSSGRTAGDVLTQLTPVLADVEHLREVQRPLRDLLAEIYLGADTEGAA